jgi:glycosyltransferase involved in cell wall biosynthesis
MIPKPPMIALDTRATSHMSVGMLSYARAIAARVPLLAPDLSFATFGSGDNFDLNEQVKMPLWIVRNRPRLVHFLCVYTPRVIPAPYVVTIHDLIDLHYPQFGKKKVGPYYENVVAPVARGAARIIVDDEATIADCERYLGVDPKRVRVVPLGIDDPPEAPRFTHSRPYLLYVGNRRQHKDLRTLYAAWRAMHTPRPIDLLLSGDEDADLHRREQRDDGGEIVFLGERTDAELRAVYAGAVAYVHPALREGFGLPLLEAARSGTPVIAAETSIPGVLRPYVIGFGAGDADALRRELNGAFQRPDVARERAHIAQEATRDLTWDRCAQRTIDVYRELL